MDSPGLRVGYSLAHPQVADVMNRVRQPFNVNGVALAAAVAALNDMEFVARSYADNLQGMRQIEEGARALGLEWIPSYGNFITVRVGRAAEIYRRLLKRGVIVRPVGGGLSVARTPARDDRHRRRERTLPFGACRKPPGMRA
jgi:histidinol-phosphate aminotransferase